MAIDGDGAVQSLTGISGLSKASVAAEMRRRRIPALLNVEFQESLCRISEKLAGMARWLAPPMTWKFLVARPTKGGGAFACHSNSAAASV